MIDWDALEQAIGAGHEITIYGYGEEGAVARLDRRDGRRLYGHGEFIENALQDLQDRVARGDGNDE